MFSDKGINFLVQLFDNDKKMKTWSTIKEEFDLKNKFYFQYLQLMHAIPDTWKLSIKDSPLKLFGG